MKKADVNEIYFIRLIACLSIVMIHSMTKVIFAQPIGADTKVVYQSLQMALMFGTPMFVMISEFVAAYVYGSEVPQGFLWKRIKYILLPCLVIGFFYAWHDTYRVDWSWAEFKHKLIYYSIGEWHGYFVLIIFQFYVLHMLFVKYAKLVKPLYVILSSFVISVGYWLLMHFVIDHPILGSTYISATLTKICCLGWLFYFVIAYYAGRNYEKLIATLHRFRWWLAAGVAASLAFLQYVFHSDILIKIGSSRFDVVVYTVMIFFALFYIASRMKQMPRWILWTSSFSYGIYLLHPFYQTLFVGWLRGVEMHYLIYQFIHFAAGIVLPMLTMYLITRIPYGEFVVGQLSVARRKRKSAPPAVAADGQTYAAS